MKGVSNTINNEVKEQNGGFFSMFLSTLGAGLLNNLLTGIGVKVKIPEGAIISGQDF